MSTATPHAGADKDDTLNVVVRPRRLYALALILGLLLEFMLPSSLMDLTWLEPHQRLFGTAVSACGFLLLSLCMMAFHRAGTTAPTNLPVHTIADGAFAQPDLSWRRDGRQECLDRRIDCPGLTDYEVWHHCAGERHPEREFGSADLSYKELVRRWLQCMPPLGYTAWPLRKNCSFKPSIAGFTM